MGFRVSGGSYPVLSKAPRISGRTTVVARAVASALTYARAAGGQLSFVSAPYSGFEGAVLQFGVTRQNGASGTIAVDWTIDAGEGQPVSPGNAGTITWNPAEAGLKTVGVILGLVTANRTRTITLSNLRSLSGGAAPTLLGGATATITVTNDTVVPGTVTLLATPTSASVVALTAGGGADGQSGFKEYAFYRSPSGAGGTYIEIARQVGTTFSDTGRSPATTYFYRVDALDNAGNITSATATATTLGGVSTIFPLTIAADGHHFADKNGNPYFLNIRASWSYLVQLTSAEADSYLDNLVLNNFNGMIVELNEHFYSDNPPRNQLGQQPFTTPEDIRTINDAYYATCATFIQKCFDRNIAVMLAPAYWGFLGAEEGWYNSAFSLRTTGECGTYATNIAGKFASFTNIIWVLGGDFGSTASAVVTRATAIANAIKAVIPTAIIMYHADRGHDSAFVVGGQSWLNANATYTNHDDIASLLLASYTTSPTRPNGLFEGYYEGLTATAQEMRAQAYLAVVLGCAFTAVGIDILWQFSNGWETMMNTQGSLDRKRLPPFLATVAWHKVLADTNASVLTAGGGINTGAGRASDGSLVLVYTPTQKALTVAMSAIVGDSADTYFFNPSTGATTSVTNFPNTGSRAFTPPSAGDWVLVIKAVVASIAVINHGVEFVLTGSGFGVKSPLAPLIYDNQKAASLSAAGWTGTYPNAIPSPNQGKNMAYQPVGYQGVAAFHPRMTKYSVAGTVSGFSNGASNHMLVKGFSAAPGTITFKAGWMGAHPNFNVDGTNNVAGEQNRNWKIFNYNLNGNGPYESEAPPVGSAYTDYDQNQLVNNTASAQIKYSPSPDHPMVRPDLNGHSNGWSSVANPCLAPQYWEVETKYHPTDGYQKIWCNGALVMNYRGPTSYSAAFSSISECIGGYAGAYDNGSNGVSIANCYRYFGDWWVDKTPQRVMLCNNAVYASATVRRVQGELTAWADGQIKFLGNLDQFTVGSTAFLVVIDASGSQIGTGMPVQIGPLTVSHGSIFDVPVPTGLPGVLPVYQFTGGAAGPLETTALGAIPSSPSNNDGGPSSTPGFNFIRFSSHAAVINDAIRGKCFGRSTAGGDESSHEVRMAVSPAVGSKVMIKSWGRYQASDTGGAQDGTQWKLERTNAGLSAIEDPGAADVLSTFNLDNGGAMLYVQSGGDVAGSKTFYLNTGAGRPVLDGQWRRSERKYTLPTAQNTANGHALIRWRRTAGVPYISGTSSDGLSNLNQLNMYPDARRFVSHMWQNWYGNGLTAGSWANDDHYVQFGSYFCIEVWDTIDPNTASKWEIAEMLLLLAGGVRIRFNQGALAPGNYFVVVLADTEQDTVLNYMPITVV